MTLDLTARRYGQRPSSLLALPLSPVLALELDAAVMFIGQRWENQMMKAAREKAGQAGGDGEPGAHPEGLLHPETSAGAMTVELLYPSGMSPGRITG